MNTCQRGRRKRSLEFSLFLERSQARQGSKPLVGFGKHRHRGSVPSKPAHRDTSCLVSRPKTPWWLQIHEPGNLRLLWMHQNAQAQSLPKPGALFALAKYKVRLFSLHAVNEPPAYSRSTFEYRMPDASVIRNQAISMLATQAGYSKGQEQ